jgi:hypothetical protein
MSSKKFYVFYGVILIIAFLCGKYSQPYKEKIETKTDTTKDLKIAELERQLKYKSSDMIQITTTIKRKDGTEITRVKLENKQLTVESSEVAKTSNDHETLHKEEKKELQNRQGVVAGPMITFPTSDFAHPLYGAVLDDPIIGPFHAFGALQVGPAVGVAFSAALGYEF